MTKIPYKDLRNKADQTTCPKCTDRGVSPGMIEPCVEHDAVRCLKCGWEESLLDDGENDD